jgi:hypothetical protein
MKLDLRTVLRVHYLVIPHMRIIFKIIEFLRSIIVMNITVLHGSDGIGPGTIAGAS